MRLLQIFHKPPYPSIDGGCFAMKNMLEGLVNQGVNVDLLIISTPKHPFNILDVPEFVKNNCQIHVVEIDTSLRINGAIKGLLKNTSYHITRFYSKELERKVEEIFKENEYDIVHYESIFSTTLIDKIKQLADVKHVIRTHNVEHLIWERLASQEKGKLKKVYLNKLAKQLKDYELDVLRKADALIPITEVDKAIFLQLLISKPKLTIPFGVNVNQESSTKMEEVRLYHLASMDWIPNLEAVDWFLNEVWGNLQDVTLYLAGKNMPDRILQLNSDLLKVEGEINDPQRYIADKNVLIVPLISGSGIRVKVIEAMERGKCVISTTIGLEGINAEDKHHVLIANTADEFVKAIDYLKRNPVEIQRIGNNARALVEAEHDNATLSRQLMDFYEKLIEK